MGYCRMPEPQDYFDEKVRFQGKIGKLIKEGRFKCLEQWTRFNDDLILLQRQMKSEYDEENVHDKIPKITKKLNKIQRKAHDPSSVLVLLRNNFFDGGREQVQCILLQDAKSNFILGVQFSTKPKLVRVLQQFRGKNYRVYFQRHLLTLADVTALATQHSLYCSGILQQQKDLALPYDLQTNGQVMVLKLRSGGDHAQSQYLASTADGFHRYSHSDKRSYATVQLQDNLKKAEEYQTSSDQYRCQFSCIDLNGQLFTEIIEIVIWNSFVSFKELLNHRLAFVDFRLLLAQQLLAHKIKPYVKTSHSVSQHAQTDKSGNYSHAPKPPIQQFHIPTKLLIPAKLRNTITCLVCRKNDSLLTQCNTCSQVSGKLISLCGKECFPKFHTKPSNYIENAADLPSTQHPAQHQHQHQQTQAVHEQYEQSTMAHSISYQQTLQSRFSKTKP